MITSLLLMLAADPAVAAERSAYPLELALPRFPDSALGGKRDTFVCPVMMELGKDGVPINHVVDECAGDVLDEVKKGLDQWRFGPLNLIAKAPVTVAMWEPKVEVVWEDPVRVDHTLRPKRAESPAFTQGATAEWGQRTVVCATEVAIASNGQPVVVVVSNCPVGFQRDIATALLKWRFDKHEHGLVWRSEHMSFTYTSKLATTNMR